MCCVVKMMRRCSSSRSEWDRRECCVARPSARSPAAARAWARHGRRRCWPAASGQAVSIMSRCPHPSLTACCGRSARVLTSWIISVPASPSEVAKRPVRARFSLAPSGHSLARAVAASRPPRCAISKRSHRPLALVLQGEDTAASADSDRAASAATERDRLRPLSLGATRMNDSASRDRKSESCLQFLRGARNLSRRPRDKGRRERRSASARLDRGAHQTPEWIMARCI